VIRFARLLVAEFARIPLAARSRPRFLRIPLLLIGFALTLFCCCSTEAADEPASRLRLAWSEEWLTIRGPQLPGGEVRVHYLEAFCRSGSTDRDWKETVIPHRTELKSIAAAGDRLSLRSTLADGVIVDHEIAARRIDAEGDEVEFRLNATNPTDKPSDAQWAQPCIRVDKFTGRSQADYIPFCFIYVDGKQVRLPTKPWAEKARYIPGQVYRAAGVSRDDVNPRPLSSLVPSNGLTGCYSSDGRQILATAWEPYQELFQGVGVCIHSDFRIGGLKPKETKSIRGKLYLTTADELKLLKLYRADFPEQQRK
jgi:hypothetical protein